MVLTMNVPAIAKLAVAAVLGALIGGLLIGGMPGVLLGTLLAGGGTYGIQHGMGPWLREIPQRLSEWRTEKDSAAFGAATAAAGFPGPVPAGPAVAAAPPAMPAPPAAAPRRSSAPADVVAGGPAAGGGSAAQGDALSMIGALVAEASYGDLRNVHRVISTLSAIQDGAGNGLVTLATRLAEPTRDYGSAIWEPVNSGGHQARASAMYLAQAVAALSSLASMTVGELAASTTHAPHSSQLNGAA
jgi:hypothetical protein